MNILVKEPEYTFEEYKTEYCNYKYEDEIKDDCKNMYDNSLITGKKENYYQKRNLYTSIINVVIVGTGLLIINRKKPDKEKK